MLFPIQTMFKNKKIACAFMASTIRTMSSALTTSINLKDPSLLRAPAITFHRESLEVYDPSSSKEDIENGSAVIGLVEVMDRNDARKAIERSKEAFEKWKSKTTGMERSIMLAKWSHLMTEHADDLAKIMTLESGKPMKESLGEVAYGKSFVDYYAGEALKSNSAGGGSLHPSPFSHADGAPRGKLLSMNQPVGVTAMVTPWNFPLAMIARKVAPALAAGCTVVLKPSELTPLSAIALKELANRAGIPENVFQVIVADKRTTPEVGEEFCKNPIVKKISFTGSTTVGKLLMKMSSDTVKRLSLELGGNAPFIVFEDANLEQAANAAIASKFRNAGQTCVCADRFIIHESVEEEFIQILLEKISQIKVGPGLNEETTMGPLIEECVVSNIQEKVDEAIADGAECLVGGSPMTHVGPNFFEPTVLRNVLGESRIWNTETFGPVVAIRTFLHEDDAVELANDTNTGLASYFMTTDIDRIFRVSERLDNGLVGINDGVISTAVAPFGGMKESGLGREGSDAGIEEYLEKKYVFINT